VFLTSFFSTLPVYGFQKKLENFCVVLLYTSEILSKNSAKLWFLFFLTFYFQFRPSVLVKKF